MNKNVKFKTPITNAQEKEKALPVKGIILNKSINENKNENEIKDENKKDIKSDIKKEEEKKEEIKIENKDELAANKKEEQNEIKKIK